MSKSRINRPNGNKTNLKHFNLSREKPLIAIWYEGRKALRTEASKIRRGIAL